MVLRGVGEADQIERVVVEVVRGLLLEAHESSPIPAGLHRSHSGRLVMDLGNTSPAGVQTVNVLELQS